MSSRFRSSVADPWADALPPRVLMLMTRNQRRGPELYATQVAHGLTARGMTIDIRSLAPAPPGVARLPVAPLGRTPLAPATLARLRGAICRNDAVIAFGSTTLPASVIAGAAAGRPIIYKNIGEPLYWSPTRGRRVRSRMFLRRVAAVAALTQKSSREIEQHFGVRPDRIKVISNARSSHAFRPPTAREKETARMALGLPAEGAIVTVVGALSPEKSVEVAVKAIARVPGPVHLAIAGDGPLRTDLHHLADAVAPGRVSFLGACADMPQVFSAADLVLLTSSSEGLPGVLIEAGLSGLPVVATDVGYVADVVVHGRTGLLVRSGDVDAVAAAVSRVLRERGPMGEAARRHCLEEFDLERVNDAWAELVNDVVLRGGS